MAGRTPFQEAAWKRMKETDRRLTDGDHDTADEAYRSGFIDAQALNAYRQVGWISNAAPLAFTSYDHADPDYEAHMKQIGWRPVYVAVESADDNRDVI